MKHENCIKFKLQCPQVELYWNTALFIIYILSVAAFRL